MPKNQEPIVVTSEFHVRYAETDAMGVVHHASYLVYFEEGRCQFMRELGNDYANIEKDGFRLPVTEVSLRYVGSLRYGDRVKIRTRVEENKSRRIRFAYEVINSENGEILVSGFTHHIWTDLTGKVTRAPKQWTEMLATAINT